MKNLFIIGGIALLSYSCTQDEILSPEVRSSLNAELENVVSQYEESLKDEQTPTTTIETLASPEVIKAIQDSIRALNNSYMSGKVKTAALLDTGGPPPRVGVFKVSTCGTYGEFVYLMDCEDGGWTNTEGNVGATFANGNKNIEFHFCLVPPADYNGGTLLLTTYGWAPIDGDVDIVGRYHDNEDHGNTNKIMSSGGGALLNRYFPGHCGFDTNTLLTWRFSERKNGTLPFQYGVLTNSFTVEDGKLNVDDENGGNENNAHLWRHKASDGSTTERYLTGNERFRGIGHMETGNTTYYLKINNN